MLLRHLFCLNQMSLVGVVQRDTHKSKNKDDLMDWMETQDFPP